MNSVRVRCKWLTPCVHFLVAVLGGGVVDGHAQEWHATGQEVVPAYEGWEQNPDGSFHLVFGYMNRNWEAELDIPVGPNNNIEPGGPDRGQPTHFLPRRSRFVFRVGVPSDFGDKEVVWTLTSPNGETKKAFGTLHPDYYIDDLVIQQNFGAPTNEDQHVNQAPELEIQGGTTRTVRVGQPLRLTAVATDDGLLKPYDLPPTRLGYESRVTMATARGLRLAWFVYRGSGTVTFHPQQFKVWEDTREGANSPWGPGWTVPPLPPDGTWVSEATFDEPGTYALRCLAHDGGLMTFEDVTVTVVAQ